MTLVGFLRPGRFNAYTGRDRIALMHDRDGRWRSPPSQQRRGLPHVHAVALDRDAARCRAGAARRRRVGRGRRGFRAGCCAR